MAPLASIDEACDAPPSDKGRVSSRRSPAGSRQSRRQSRIVFVANRRSRARSATRNTTLARRRRRQSSHRISTIRGDKDAQETSRPKDSQQVAEDEHCPEHYPDENKPASLRTGCQDNEQESESSIDLELFPVPPSGTRPQKQPFEVRASVTEGTKPQEHKSSSPVNRAAPKKDSCIVDQPGSPAVKTTTKETSRLWSGDAANDRSTSLKLSYSDSALVEAISRNVAQQLRLLSLTEDDRGYYQNAPAFVNELEHQYEGSRTSSQRAKLGQFTEDLRRYADNMEASGKILNFTPTPTRSGATLRTVSALMPFRSEFREAGLAVTSRDQAQRVPPFLKRNQECRGQGPMPLSASTHQLSMSQLDGKGLGGLTNSAATCLPFVTQSFDDWGYPLKRDGNMKRTKSGTRRTQPRSRCLPCFPAEMSQTTDGAETGLDPMAANMGSMAAVTSRMLSPPGPGGPRAPKPPGFLGNSSSVPRPFPKRNTAATVPMTRHAFDDSLRMRPKPRYPGARRPFMPRPSLSSPAGYDAGPFPTWNAINERGESRRIPPNGRTNQTVLGRFPDLHPATVRGLQQYDRRPYQSLPSERIAQDLAREHYRTGGTKVNHSAPDVAFPWNQGYNGEHLATRGAGGGIREKPINPPSHAATTAAVESQHITSSSETKRQPDERNVSREGKVTESRRPAVPKRTSSIRGTGSSGRSYTDRDVLRGLNVAASAACDEEVDAYVRHKTGLQIRRFLADLVVLETLGDAKSTDNSEIVKQRRKDLRKLKQHIRRTREFKRRSGIDQ